MSHDGGDGVYAVMEMRMNDGKRLQGNPQVREVERLDMYKSRPKE